MIGFVRGNVEGIYPDYVLVDVNGIGYNVFMPGSLLDSLPGLGSEIKLYTYLSVREDAMHLYGFLRKDELDIFKLLIQVNGIGPKGALSLLNIMSADDLRFAIISGDSKTISKAPGVGAKTAQRIIIDLNNNLSKDSSGSMLGADDYDTGNEAEAYVNEAIEALCALGYSKKDAVVAVNRAKKDAGSDVEVLIKAALKQMI